MNSTYIRTVVAIGLPLAVIGAIIIAIGYINDQQTLRQLANDPQIYLAQDASLRVLAGGKPGGFANAIPIESDTAPYILFFNATGTAIAGTGLLHSAPPTLPQGVLDTAKQNGRNAITWEPEPGLRHAIVVIPAGQYFVVSGRSLKFTEEQSAALAKRALIGWLLMLVSVVIVSMISAYLLRKPRKLTERNIDVKKF